MRTTVTEAKNADIAQGNVMEFENFAVRLRRPLLPMPTLRNAPLDPSRARRCVVVSSVNRCPFTSRFRFSMPQNSPNLTHNFAGE